jgi:hypothetical protein
VPGVFYKDYWRGATSVGTLVTESCHVQEEAWNKPLHTKLDTARYVGSDTERRGRGGRRLSSN